MATQEDKDRKAPTTGTASKGGSNKNTGNRPAKGKDQDTYDPVGMAGKKAGIVEDLEEQQEQQGTVDSKQDRARGRTAKGKG